MKENSRDFDKAASSWDEEPRRVKLAADVAGAVMQEVELSHEMDVLDYGCGTGLVALHLQPHVRSVTGADTSQGMLEVLKKKVAALGLTNVYTALIDPAKDTPVEGTFHLIVSSMTMHHVRDVEDLFKKFYRLLTPGGEVCVADLDAEDGSFHSDAAGVVHNGFDRRDVRDMLQNAGFADILDRTASAIVKEGEGAARHEYPIFLIIARKAH